MNQKLSISISNEEYTVFITMNQSERCSTELISQMALAAKKAADAVLNGNVDIVDKKVDNLRPTTVQQKTQERPPFRDRLPNNVVDVKELDIKQAVTEEALVRCPHCGQAHCLAVNSGSKVYLMEREFSSNEFNIIADFDSLTSDSFANVCCKPETDRLAYFNDLQNAPIVSHEDFAADNETEVFCPVCCKSDTFMNWKNAFEHPLDYFETEHLCDVCGGESLPQMVKGKPYKKCDICGHTSDYKGE